LRPAGFCFGSAALRASTLLTINLRCLVAATDEIRRLPGQREAAAGFGYDLLFGLEGQMPPPTSIARWQRKPQVRDPSRG
jgi:hypothetical protein